MFELDYTKDTSPTTNSEKFTYYAFLSVVMIAFLAELLIDYQPMKLTAIVFIIAWIPLTFLHELGHAIVARVVGWQVLKFVIGYGKVIKEFQYKGTQVELRMIPLSGYVLPKSTEFNWSRTKSALVYFAGPGIELIVFIFLYAIIGFGRFTEPSTNYATIILQGIALSAVTGAVINLIPQSAITENGETPNDGLGIILSLIDKRH